MFSDIFHECIKNDGIVSIGTCSAEGKAHIVNTWNKYLIITEDNKILIPAFGMVHTEKNIKENPYMEVSLGSHEVQGLMGMGTGFLMTGTGKFEKSGELFEKMKAKCDFTRRVLIFSPETCKQTI